MGQFSTLLSAALLVAVFKPDNLVTSIPSLDHSSTEEIERKMAKRSNGCLDDDSSKSDKVLCSRIPNYPTTHLENLMKEKFSNLDKKYGEDFVMPVNSSNSVEEFLCRSRVRVIYPQSAMNKEYNWLVVVNVPNYKQGIRIEECLDHGEACGKQNGISLPNRFKAVCEQDYIFRKLIGYKNEDVVAEEFKVPSCCKCVLKRH